MALVGPTLLTADPDTSNIAAFPTPSVSPTSDALILVYAWSTAAAAADPTGVAAAFATVAGFTKRIAISAVGGVRNLSLWQAVATGSPGSGAVTVTYAAAQTGCIVTVVQYTGQDTTTPTLQPASNEGGGAGTTSLSISLAGPLSAATNQICAGIGHAVNEDQTAGSGGTELALSDVGYATPTARLAIYSELNDNTVSASWTTAAAKLAVAIEVVEATSVVVDLPILVMAPPLAG